MLGIIILLIVLGAEVGFAIYSLVTKSYPMDKKSILSFILFGMVSLLLCSGIVSWGFRWFMLFLVLFLKAAMGAWYFVNRKKRKEKTFQKKYVIMSMIRNCFLLGFAVFPAILFPQFNPVEVTGEYPVETVSYTLTDPERAEQFSGTQEKRQVTIQFWYPKTVSGKVPLLVFSHGSFGFRGSNASTFVNLASNGYVVCSIDHTYHAFFTKQTDGKIVIANMEFINDAIAATNNDYDEQKTYELTRQWMKLRVSDMNFVLDEVLKNIDQSNDSVYQFIDREKIGLFGHSLGGACAAETGRKRADIDAVIVIDGTMLGEEVGFEDGKIILNATPYPIPLLNLYNEEHYKEAKQLAKEYANTFVSKNAADARDIVIKASGHLNFTDLPLFSPVLARMLGTGEVDRRYCIETMNRVILEYFNYYLKAQGKLELLPEY